MIYGNTYTFSTCYPTIYSGYDTVIVLRSPNGIKLAANDDCIGLPTGSYCSSISYTHNDVTFGSVYLSVYKKQLDKSTNKYICTSTSTSTRIIGYVYASLTNTANGVTNCNFNLVCKTSASFYQGDTITFDDFVDWTKSDLCGITSSTSPVYFSYGDLPSVSSVSVNCDYGTEDTKITLYGVSCVSKAIITPPSYTLTCGSSGFIYPNSFLSNCQFGVGCNIGPSYYTPDVDISGTCDSDYTLDVEPSTYVAMIGDFVTYDISAIFSNEAIATTSCTEEILGIVPQSLYSFEIDGDGNAVLPLDPDYLFDGTQLYFDTIYRLEFVYDLEDTPKSIAKRAVNDFQLYVVQNLMGTLSSSNGNYANSIPEFVFFEEENCNANMRKRAVGDCTNCCTGYIDFCIPASSGDPDNVEANFESNLAYSLVIANGKTSTGNSILDNYVVSVGNPLVILSPANGGNNTPECSAFATLHVVAP